MLYEVLKDDTGRLYLERIAGWRNNPACIKLLNVKSEAEAEAVVNAMTAECGTDTVQAAVPNEMPPEVSVALPSLEAPSANGITPAAEPCLDLPPDEMLPPSEEKPVPKKGRHKAPQTED